MSRRLPAVDHPAPYSPEIIDVFARILPGVLANAKADHVHDCFAGTGERLGYLIDELNLDRSHARQIRFSGTDLAPGFMRHPGIVYGDATDPKTYPKHRSIVVTSPVYPNGIADNFNARDRCSLCRGTGELPHDDGFVRTETGSLIPYDLASLDDRQCHKCGGSGQRNHRRRTYRSWHAKIMGADAELHPNNMGRWGYRGSSVTAPARMMYWSLAERTILAWSMTKVSALVVNVSDFMVKDRVEPVTDPWIERITRGGIWAVDEVIPVGTQRWNFGTGGSKRVAAEHVIVAYRADKHSNDTPSGGGS